MTYHEAHRVDPSALALAEQARDWVAYLLLHPPACRWSALHILRERLPYAEYRALVQRLVACFHLIMQPREP